MGCCFYAHGYPKETYVQLYMQSLSHLVYSLG